MKIVLLAILFLPLCSNSQQEKYTSFGEAPNPIEKRLYTSLKNTTDPIQKIKIIDSIAYFHIQNGNSDSIIHYGNYLRKTVIKHQKEILDSDQYISKSYHILGKGKLKRGLLDDAMASHIKGISISPVSTMNQLFYTHQLDLAIVYMYKREYDQALPIIQNCIKNAKDKNIQLLAKKTLADFYSYKKEFTKAQPIYLDLLLKFNPKEHQKLILETELNLGIIDRINDNSIKAMNRFSKIKEEALNNHFYDLYIDTVLQMGIVYYKIKDYDSAEMIFSTAYVNSLSWNRLELQKDVIEMLTNLYNSKKDYKNAYHLMTQYKNVSNKILENQNKEVVKEMEVKYQTLQKEKEIKRQRTIKYAFLIGFLITLIPIIALLLVYFQKLKTQIKLNQSQEEVNQQKVHGLMKEQELYLIKATMNGQDHERQRLARELHDSIGGNLASIKLQLSNTEYDKNSSPKIINQIDETYHLVRDISHNLASKKFRNNGVATLIREYITNIQSSTDQQISFNPYPEKQINSINTPLKEELFKIIQELLTNCLKHAKATHIDIYMNHYETSLQLLFEDNGVGFDVKKISDGIGFKNIKKRLDMLAGKLLIDTAPNRGTVVNIEIPLDES
ncbi:tetratricopeptide repeat-containing sensor histidine kinase [Aquimarina addita]|uniref:tetratricopeptide repeat-containing sensor histidine kinase n=1 Tax=Aquimarina addita TaxID=870485 RepID=UPI0031EAA5FC